MQTTIILSALLSFLPLVLTAPCTPTPDPTTPDILASSQISYGTILTEDNPDAVQEMTSGVPVQFRQENQKSMTSLLVFEFPTASADWANKRCTMHFDSPVLAFGSRAAAVYKLTSNEIEGSTWNYRKGVQRDGMLGIFEVEEMRKAEWYVGWNGEVACPTTPGGYIAIELVPVGAYVALEWMMNEPGLRIEVTDL